MPMQKHPVPIGAAEMVIASMLTGASSITPGPKVVVKGAVKSEEAEKGKKKKRAAVKERDEEVAKERGLP